MQQNNREIDISRNILLIESLKSVMLSDVADIFAVMADSSESSSYNKLTNLFADLILTAFLLGKRIGIGYNAVESKIAQKIRLGLVENSDLERYYGDLSELNRKYRQ